MFYSITFAPHSARSDLIDNHKSLFVGQIHEFFRIWIMRSPEAICSSPLHQVEIFDQSDSVESSSSQLE